MLYLNDNEEKIISSFIEIESNYANKILRLIWSDGIEVVAKYDSFIEDENENDFDSEGYEEYWSFVFVGIDTSKKAPIDITDDGFFTINYQNFPEKILCEDEVVYERK